ncbi:alpha-L-fucosidase [Flavivirga spongiicola]|uniref:alpha-L-fucosidase n=1 Tax=Flavivirga spongiicola TaxID=421621 RepID=A0ABU7XRE7_9FLAO|nr:alpha-L-fucosidase [Flavivirga sp. MEBiC05379]MDO5977474.1 alpha-L-fucosidase [Flavivirga sp. MEBiC05379]
MKKSYLKTLLIGLLLGLCYSCAQNVTKPKPYGPIPTERQLAWHDMEYYAFIHFNMNTFTNMEWGDGSEKPAQFNPTALDAKQWVKTIKDAGMKGVIITAKHHDGFCLWPSKYTEHSVKNAPWKNGQGDVLKDLSEACAAYGLKMGVYLSPWDRNHAQYGKPEYVSYFHNQLRELLTNYGDIFEVWFDGANGGSGYYGGANETRKIDNKTYYQWDKAIEIVRELQPNAVIFGDGGPGVRWVGNEEGWANETNWSLLRKKEVYPGYSKYKELRSGHEDGTHWVPAECDVSIRPGWYYHPSEDIQVKSLSHLVDIYYQSIGRNASLLLNLPVDHRGLVHEKDVEQLMALKQQVEQDFSNNIAKNIKVTATNVRGNKAYFEASNTIDGDKNTYWATEDTVTEASMTLEFETPTEVNRILLQEYINLGQRVYGFNVEAEVNGNWVIIDTQTTIGVKRILRFDTIKASKIRVNITGAKASPLISNIELYRAPNLLTQPVVKRDKKGFVSMDVADKNIDIYYTIDGTEPTSKSNKYNEPFSIDAPTVINVIAYDAEKSKQTVSKTIHYDISKKDWKVIKVSSGKLTDAHKIIDDNPNTSWASNGENTPNEVVIDLGKVYQLEGFTYTPVQGRWPYGIVSNYEFSVSQNNKTWTTAITGEFGNIKNSPIKQTVRFNTLKGRYIKLKGLKIVDNDKRFSASEIGVITKQ